MSCIASLFKAFAYRHQRLGVLDDVDGSLYIRDLPDDEGAQDRMHNERMTAVRLTLHQVSEARVNWLLAGGVTAQPRNSARADGTVGGHFKKRKIRQRRVEKGFASGARMDFDEAQPQAQNTQMYACRHSQSWFAQCVCKVQIDIHTGCGRATYGASASLPTLTCISELSGLHGPSALSRPSGLLGLSRPHGLIGLLRLGIGHFSTSTFHDNLHDGLTFFKRMQLNTAVDSFDVWVVRGPLNEVAQHRCAWSHVPHCLLVRGHRQHISINQSWRTFCLQSCVQRDHFCVGSAVRNCCLLLATSMTLARMFDHQMRTRHHLMLAWNCPRRPQMKRLDTSPTCNGKP